MAQSTPDDEALTRTVIVRTATASPAPAAADDDRAHYLVVVDGAERGRRIALGAGNVVIGRAKPADIVLADPIVSRSHCRLELVMGELFVTDLGSSNGTFVGGRKVMHRSHVAPGERISVGTHVLEHEWRSRREVESVKAVDTDLEKAKQYVRSLLPTRIEQGKVRTDWVLQPCARLGGDLFGYHYIDDHTFAIYLVDVTGHGIDAAMHAVSVMNVLRQRSLPGIDVRDPARMASYLNEIFQMDRHGGMLLSLWYGVFDLASRTITYTSGGHHPSYLVNAGRESAIPLAVPNVLIGMIPDYDYRNGHAQILPGTSLYLFSDGVFEIELAEEERFGIDNFAAVLMDPAEPGKPESQRILEAVMERTGRRSFEDDFTLVVATIG